MMKNTVVLVVLAVAIGGVVVMAVMNNSVQETRIQQLNTRLNTLEQAYADLKTEMDGMPASMGTGLLTSSRSIPSTPEPTLEPTPEPTPEPEPEYLQFSNDQFDYSFMYQRNWTQEAGGRRGNTFITFKSPDRKICNAINSECFAAMSLFTVEVDQNPSTTDLDDYFNKAVARMQEEYAITATSKSPTTYISDVKAYGINYVTRDERGNPKNQIMQYFTVIDDKVYILTYNAPYSVERDNLYDTYQRDAMHIVETFNVTRVYKPVINPTL